MLTRRIEAHDDNQLELRLAYSLGDRKGPGQHYTTEVYLFVPRALGVTRETYPRARFYEDTSSFVRLQTPRVALAALGDEAEARRWFDRVDEPLSRQLAGERSSPSATVHGLKLLGCVYRGAMRREAEALGDRFAGADGLEPAVRVARLEAIARDLAPFPAQIEAALRRLRALGRRCEQAAAPQEVTDGWRAVDELVAIVAEEVCTDLVEALERHAPGAPQVAEVRDALAAEATAQYHYRRGRGYPSFVVPGEENEAFPYRRALLRRMVSSALFLDVQHPDVGTFATNIGGVIAACIAMLFAVSMTIWATQRFDMASAAFVLVAVGSYAVKDRLKEWGKRLFGRRAARYVPDQLVRINDPETGALLGSCRETVSILPARGLPEDVMALRHADHPDATETDARPETVIRYTKQMQLRPIDRKDQEEARALNDIVRFDLGHLRGRMDAPYEDRRYVDPETGELTSVRCARVQHVNLLIRVVRGRGRKTTTEVDRVRVIMDQRGIKRVEPVALTPGRGAVRSPAARTVPAS